MCRRTQALEEKQEENQYSENSFTSRQTDGRKKKKFTSRNAPIPKCKWFHKLKAGYYELVLNTFEDCSQAPMHAIISKLNKTL